jgi:hypothetical protein
VLPDDAQLRGNPPAKLPELRIHKATTKRRQHPSMTHDG